MLLYSLQIMPSVFRLYYYRKDVWAQIIRSASKLMTLKEIWTPATIDASVQYKVRFCPKRFGVRPIMRKTDQSVEANLVSFSFLSVT